MGDHHVTFRILNNLLGKDKLHSTTHIDKMAHQNYSAISPPNFGVDITTAEKLYLALLVMDDILHYRSILMLNKN